MNRFVFVCFRYLMQIALCVDGILHQVYCVMYLFLFLIVIFLIMFLLVRNTQETNPMWCFSSSHSRPPGDTFCEIRHYTGIGKLIRKKGMMHRRTESLRGAGAEKDFMREVRSSFSKKRSLNNIENRSDSWVCKFFRRRMTRVQSDQNISSAASSRKRAQRPINRAKVIYYLSKRSN